MDKKTIRAVMQELGRRGGSKKSPAKTATAKANAKKGWITRRKRAENKSSKPLDNAKPLGI